MAFTPLRCDTRPSPLGRLPAIRTCELNGANPFDYFTEFERHAGEVVMNPESWMLWNYRQALGDLATSPSRRPLTPGRMARRPKFCTLAGSTPVMGLRGKMMRVAICDNH